MLNICSLFQKFFGFIKNVQKKTYRNCMVIVSGVTLVSIICLTAKDFGGSGKNGTSVNQDKNGDVEAATEEDETDANAMVQKMLFSYGNVTENENSTSIEVYYRIKDIINTNENGFLYEMPTASVIPMSTELLAASNEKSTETLIQEKKVTEVTTEVVTEASTETPTEAPTEAPTETVTEATTESITYTNMDIEVSDDDYYWLLRIVEAEAGDQDEVGRILVANVIFNRVRSGNFPSSIKSVIFQNNGRTYQFEPVKNERIYDMVPSQMTIDCVERALNGEDYSNGALYFTMKTSSSSWFNTSLTLMFVHGDHYFYTY